MYRVGIITASDKGARGEREDLSGKVIQTLVEEAGYEVASYVMVADELDALANAMKQMADDEKIELILTTGGTGFSQRDVTPEATKSVIEREAQGIAEAMRYNSLKITPKGMLSRGIAGIRGKSLIINMPGSPKAVRESLEYILGPIHHGIQILLGEDAECARPDTK